MMKLVAKNVMYTVMMKLIVFANISALALEKTHSYNLEKYEKWVSEVNCAYNKCKRDGRC
jgi:hypothetical protein